MHESRDEDVSAVNEALLHGDEANADGSGIVLVREGSFNCSGTLVTNDWVLTAQHCVFDGPDGEAFDPTVLHKAHALDDVFIYPRGGNPVTEAKTGVDSVVAHPTLDVALLHLKAPIAINGLTYGFARPLYNQATSTLVGQSLACYGYGRFSTVLLADSPDGKLRLREGDLTARSSTTTEKFELDVNKKKGQITFSGDSGGPCFVRDTSGLGFDMLAGVNAQVVVSKESSGFLGAVEVSVSAIANWIADNAFAKPRFAPLKRTDIADGSGWDPRARMVDLDGKNGADWVYPSSAGLNWMLAHGDGTLESKLFLKSDAPIDDPARIYFADVDGNGALDWIHATGIVLRVRLAVLDTSKATKPLVTFGPGKVTGFSPAHPDQGTFADVDGDGKVDAIFPDASSVSVLLGTGIGTFAFPPVVTDFGSATLGVTTFANVDGIGGVDFIAESPFLASVRTSVFNVPGLPPVGERGKLNASVPTIGAGATVFKIAHVNADALADLVVIEGTQIRSFLGTPTGAFAPVSPSHFELASNWDTAPERVSVVDLNGDGCDDFAFRDTKKVWIKPSNCDGHFGALEVDSLEPYVDCAPSTTWTNTTIAGSDLVSMGSCAIQVKRATVPPRPPVAAPIVPPPLPIPIPSTIKAGSLNSMSFADTDGSGKSDRVFLTDDGAVTASDSGQLAFVDGWCTEDVAKVLVADFNADGHPDLLCRHGNGTNSVALGDGAQFAPPGERFSFCPRGSELFAGTFFEGKAAGLMCHDPATGASTLRKPDAKGSFAAVTETRRPAFCGVKATGTCVKESNEELCWDGVDNNCNTVVDEGCPARSSIGSGQLVMGDFDADGHPDFACLESATKALFVTSWATGYSATGLTAFPITGSFCKEWNDVLYAANVDGKQGDDLVCRSAKGGLYASLSGASPFATVNFTNEDIGFCTAAGGAVQFGQFDGSGKAGIACVLPTSGLDSFPTVLNDILSHTPPPASTCPPGSTYCG
jgi:hypothetical protein